jgi:hypothetical protein
MSTFNSWVSLTGTTLDESSPMLPQLQKLNDARITLQNNDMKITDLQFSFILIKVLPESYSAVASTILVTGAPKDLTPQIIQDRILNEEGRRSSASVSLNKLAPVKKKSNKAQVKCYYCQKLGHKSNECRKKKRDTEQKEKKEKEKGSASQTPGKAVNMHISVVPATATIEEVADDNDNLHVSLYTTMRSRWMVDSGATHHITPHRSNFATWAPARGSVSLGGHAEITQIGTGTVQIWPSRGDRDVHLQDVMHVPDVEVRYFSVSMLLKKGGKIMFKDNSFTIELRGQQLAKGYMEGNLFWFDSSKVALHAAASMFPPIDSHQQKGTCLHMYLLCLIMPYWHS